MTVDFNAVGTLIAAICAGAAAIISAFNRKTSKDTKQAVVELNIGVNGRLTELLSATKAAAHAVGVQEGIDKNLDTRKE